MATTRCPLCDAPAPAHGLTDVAWARVWGSLRDDWGAALPDAVRARHEADGPLRLARCPSCGLDWFVGTSPGDGDFYAALEAGGRYYAGDRWEFGWAAAQVAAGARALDVGSGRGAFLDRLRARGARPEGAEFNPTAREAARARGLTVHAEPAEALAVSLADAFDWVTAFHVVEHLADPVGFVRSLAACARRGGRVVVSTPCRDRTWREPFEALEHPPHHLTRWSAEQLGRLGERAGLRVARVAHEPLDRATHRHAVEKRVHGAVGGALGAAAGWAASRAMFLPGVIHAADAVGAREALGAKGMSVVAVFEKP